MRKSKIPPTEEELKSLLTETEALANKAKEYDAPLAGLLLAILVCYHNEASLQGYINLTVRFLLSEGRKI